MNSPAEGPAAAANLLRTLDYSVLQQCMHCGMCLPTCPTYAVTKLERHGPRGRIALMRSIADGQLEVTRAFGEEMYFCLGCLTCETACPAGVNYAQLFETARAAVEESGVMDSPVRNAIRHSVLRGIFTRPRLLRLAGRMLWLYQASGAQWMFRGLRLNRLLPAHYQILEKQTPTVCAKFSHQSIQPVEKPAAPQHRVALLTGCVQDILFSNINRDTADVLLANGCEVHTPPVQSCCGSLHAHNGDLETARMLARRAIDLTDPFQYDAIISNAAGCGSHLKTYSHLLYDDPVYAARAVEWDRKIKDIHQWLVEIGFRAPRAGCGTQQVTYHEACHLCHGQKITRQPREILKSIPGLQLVELTESAWCCGSAGVYNITQPDMAEKLQVRKVANIRKSGIPTVATSNPGCHLQLKNGLLHDHLNVDVTQPVTLLAKAYRAES